MAFKSATVNSSLVAATLTNYPTYIDLSRVGITTLAEAQSARFYADSGKVVEWAREVVSNAQGHVKIPSLTSTTTIYVDYDGVRADYAVTDTYGRNAVWSDYSAVFHFESDATDSSGVNSAGTVTGSTIQFEQIGNGYDFDGANDKIDFGTAEYVKSETIITQQMWMRIDVINSLQQLWGTNDIGAGNSYQGYVNSTGSQLFIAPININNRANYSYSTLSTTVRYLFHIVFDGGQTGNANRLKIYNNGANDTGRTTYTGTVDASSTTATGNLVIGERSGGSGDFNGGMDELRFRKSAISDNWITTEYNNQSNETSFWGTWTDVGGGGPDPLDATTQTYTLSGIAAAITKQFAAGADQASLSLTGVDALLAKHYTFQADATAFALSASAVTFTRQFALSAEAEIISVSAPDTPILKHSVISADPADYTLTGYATFFPQSNTLGAGTGVVLLTTNEAQLLRHYVMPCSTASFTVSSIDAVTAYNRSLEAVSAPFDLDSADAQFLRSLAILGSQTSYELAGLDAETAKLFFFLTEPPAYTLSTSDALATKGYSIAAETETLALSGVPIEFILGAPPITDPFSAAASPFSKQNPIFTPKQPIGTRAPRP